MVLTFDQMKARNWTGPAVRRSKLSILSWLATPVAMFCVTPPPRGDAGGLGREYVLRIPSLS